MIVSVLEEQIKHTACAAPYRRLLLVPRHCNDGIPPPKLNIQCGTAQKYNVMKNGYSASLSGDFLLKQLTPASGKPDYWLVKIDSTRI